MKDEPDTTQIVKITKDNQGSTVQAHLHDVIEVHLPENPSTGYRWKAELGDGGVLKLRGSDYHSGGEGVGASGMRVFELQPAAAGSTGLSFKLLREWEGDGSTVERFQVTVQVLEN